MPSLPAGAKLAVIEGPLNEAVPFTMRIQMPANYQVPAHSHPAIEHVTVISSTVNMGLEDKLDRSKTKALSAGSIANHAAEDESLPVDRSGGRRPGPRRRPLGHQLRERR